MKTATATMMAAFLAASPLSGALFDWPTENRALLQGNPKEFYMFVDRNFEGVQSTPWEGGMFGFVRGPIRQGDAVVYRTLHEGIDILPVRRNASGVPQDDVRASAAGTVVHVNKLPGASNYGRYIVIEHLIENSPIYTLYAHLADIAVHPTQPVSKGEKIGTLGFTGAGIDKRRAHLHFEIAFRLSDFFETWHKRHFPGSPNKHGLYNGLNLIGVDPASILLECNRDAHYRLSTHIRSQEPAFSVVFPNTSGFSLVSRYPWLVPDGEPANPPAWKVSFTGHGAPVKALAADQAPSVPTLDWVREQPLSYSISTRGLVTGPKGSPVLSASGLRFISLITGTQ